MVFTVSVKNKHEGELLVLVTGDVSLLSGRSQGPSVYSSSLHFHCEALMEREFPLFGLLGIQCVSLTCGVSSGPPSAFTAPEVASVRRPLLGFPLNV